MYAFSEKLHSTSAPFYDLCQFGFLEYMSNDLPTGRIINSHVVTIALSAAVLWSVLIAHCSRHYAVRIRNAKLHYHVTGMPALVIFLTGVVVWNPPAPVNCRYR